MKIVFFLPHAKMIILLGLTCYFCIPWRSIHHLSHLPRSPLANLFRLSSQLQHSTHNLSLSTKWPHACLMGFSCQNVNTIIQYGSHTDLDLSLSACFYILLIFDARNPSNIRPELPFFFFKS